MAIHDSKPIDISGLKVVYMDKKTLKQFKAWGSLGGKTGASKMTPEQRKERARKAVSARWKKK